MDISIAVERKKMVEVSAYKDGLSGALTPPSSYRKRNATFSTLLSGRVVLLNGFHNDIVSFVYSQNTKRKYLFKNYLESGLRNYEICLYASDDNKNFFETHAKKNQFLFFPLKKAQNNLETISKLNENILRMRKKIEKEEEYVGLRMVLDWGTIVNDNNKDKILQVMKDLAEQKEKIPVTAISAFDVSCIETNFFENLTSIVPRTVISTDDETTISFINTYPTRPVVIDSIDHETAVDFVKKNLEPIIFSMLLRKPMCGYDIIKDISNDYHVLLSQGTVYPLLYSLTKKNILAVKSDAKAKTYAPTENGKGFMEKRLNEFRKGYSYFFSLLRTPQRTLPII